jgi:hypothetical protein
MTVKDGIWYPSESDDLRAGLRGCLDRETELIRQVANLEKQNRKLNDKLNRFRKLTPGRQRLYTLGRIAAVLEHEADEMLATSPGDGSGYQPSETDYLALVEDALFLRRLEWDFEQLLDVVRPHKQPRHEWRRP